MSPLQLFTNVAILSITIFGFGFVSIFDNIGQPAPKAQQIARLHR